MTWIESGGPPVERLARWLLMCHDRVGGNEVAVTHDFLSMMLSVRRPSVTTALHVLEGMALSAPTEATSSSATDLEWRSSLRMPMAYPRRNTVVS
jgi:hypothetical protein